MIGWINFLHDSISGRRMRPVQDIDAGVVTSEKRGQRNSAVMIRAILKLSQLDPNWSLPSRLENNPLVWML